MLISCCLPEMETQLLSKATVITFVVVTLIIWAWRMLNRVWLKPRNVERVLRAQGLAGNPYRFFVGDMKEMLTLSMEATSKPIKLSDDIVPRLLPFNVQHMDKYGKESFQWLGPIPRVNIMNPEQVKAIFTKIDDFQKPRLNPILKLIAPGFANYEGEKWAAYKKIIMPAFHLEKLKLMLPAFHESCNEMIIKWGKLASAEESCEIDVWPDIQSLTLDIISRAIFGGSFEEGKKIFELQVLQRKLTMEVIRTLQYNIPGWSFLPTNLNGRMKNVDKEIESVLRGMIRKRMEAMMAGEAAKHDLLGLLLKSYMKEMNGNKNFGMTLKDVMGECKFFYSAGRETTSILLVWTLILLSMHPQWQSRAREEVLQVFGSNKPDYDGLSHLKIVTMILHEVLRLYPPQPQVMRQVHRETKLGKWILPAGAEISVPVILIQHDKELWGDDAKEFKPERFAGGVSKATKNLTTFLPFTWGPRICTGQNFAMIQAKLTIAMILQCYSFELSPSYAHAPINILTTHPQFGAQLILRRG